MTRGRKKRQKVRKNIVSLVLKFVKKYKDRKKIQKGIQDFIIRSKPQVVRVIRVGKSKIKRKFKQTTSKTNDLLIKLNIIVLKEKPDDVLKREPYARRIAEEIKDRHNSTKNRERNVTLAISATWGSGKTFILNELLTPILEEDGFKVVKFNPWYFSQEKVAIKRGLLKAVSEQLKSKVRLEHLYKDSSYVTIKWGKIILCMFILFLLTLMGVVLYTGYGDKFKGLVTPTGFLGIVIDNAISFIGSTGIFFQGNPILLTGLAIPILLFIITQVFSVSHSVSGARTSDEFIGLFKRIVGKVKKLVIIIDDLDRCTPDVVKVVLDTLATFFEQKNCSFVIAADHTVLERYVGSSLFVEPFVNEKGEDKSETAKRERAEGRRFLKKLFDVYWQIPEPDPLLFKDFISREISKYEIENLDDIQRGQLVILLEGFLDRNLRAVERFLSTLRFYQHTLKDIIDEKTRLVKKSKKTIKLQLEQDIKDLTEVYNSPAMLAKTLMIQELFYPLYETLYQYPDMLIKHESEAKKGDVVSYLLTPIKKELLTDPLDKFLYSKLMRTAPSFMNDVNSIVFNVSNFLYLSGGLPSEKGPRDENFLDLLQGGTDLDKLLKNMETASHDRKIGLMKIARSALTNTDLKGPAKKEIILRSGKIADVVDEWEPLLEGLLDQLENEDLKKNADAKDLELFTIALFRKALSKGLHLEKIFDTDPLSKPEYAKLKWQAVEQMPDRSFTVQDSVNRIVDLAINEFATNEAESMSNIKVLLAKINMFTQETLDKLKGFYVLIANTLFSKPISEREVLLDFIIENDRERLAHETYIEKEKNLLGAENSYEEMRYFITNYRRLSSYLTIDRFNDLFGLITNFITSRTQIDWGVLIDIVLDQKDMSDLHKNALLNSIFDRVKTNEEQTFAYTLEYLKKPEFMGFFGNNILFERIVDSLKLLDDKKQIALLDCLVAMQLPEPLLYGTKKALTDLSKSKDKNISSKVGVFIKKPKTRRQKQKQTPKRQR